MKTATDVIKHEIHKSGLTLYRIAKETGIDASALGRFMAGTENWINYTLRV